jgi:hypothetical protein
MTSQFLQKFMLLPIKSDYLKIKILVAILITNSKMTIIHDTMDLHENGALGRFFKIRTITAFNSESIDADPELLSLQVKPVAEFLRKSQSSYESKGGSVYH